jgi:4-amino-4-deoxy-L-arabinose transferase-like glycosyltransferase
VVERRPAIWEGWSALASRPWHASLALLTLCLAIYLPGILRLPAVDRTEIIYAETTRDMLARGDWTDPRYGDFVHAFRPIGTFWAQAAAGALAGQANARDIRVYRIPSLVAVTLATLTLFWLGTALIGAEGALIAAGLFAVAPLTVLVSQLAIAEGLSLLPATVAMLVLARLYSAPPSLDAKGEEQDLGAPSGIAAGAGPLLLPLSTLRRRGLALIFWAAVGFGMLINALLVPILVIATLIALYVMDRDRSWLKRLEPVIGVPVALAIAAPWLLVRAHQDGTPFAGLSWNEFLAALGGAQDMKLRAYPGTFVLALVLGFLPGTALLATAASKLWDTRRERLPRFLLAWVLGYLVYLEALSSKPGTYMVQTMFPALALAVASLVVSENGSGKAPRYSVFAFWPTGLAVLPLAAFAAVYILTGTTPSPAAVILIALIAALFILSGRQGGEGLLRRWAATGIAALALFAVTLLGLILPSIEKIWPARELARVIANCPGREVSLVGFREPSGRFVLGVPPDRQTPASVAARIAAKTPSLLIIENRWLKSTNAALAAGSEQPLPRPDACVEAYNVMRGCPLSFGIYERGGGKPCTIPARYTCGPGRGANAPDPSSRCD